MYDLKPFRFWCQKVLPTVYDDSLSYYELLCKTVDYLNKTMSNVDELSDNFVTLKDFVDNYFANLDISAEVDKKLDEMAESGQLDNILNKYLNNVYPYVDLVNVEANITLENMFYLNSLNGTDFFTPVLCKYSKTMDSTKYNLNAGSNYVTLYFENFIVPDAFSTTDVIALDTALANIETYNLPVKLEKRIYDIGNNSLNIVNRTTIFGETTTLIGPTAEIKFTSNLFNSNSTTLNSCTFENIRFRGPSLGSNFNFATTRFNNVYIFDSIKFFNNCNFISSTFDKIITDNSSQLFYQCNLTDCRVREIFHQENTGGQTALNFISISTTTFTDLFITGNLDTTAPSANLFTAQSGFSNFITNSYFDYANNLINIDSPNNSQRFARSFITNCSFRGGINNYIYFNHYADSNIVSENSFLNPHITNWPVNKNLITVTTESYYIGFINNISYYQDYTTSINGNTSYFVSDQNAILQTKNLIISLPSITALQWGAMSVDISGEYPNGLDAGYKLSTRANSDAVFAVTYNNQTKKINIAWYSTTNIAAGSNVTIQVFPANANKKLN